MMSEILDLQQSMLSHGILICFSGKLTQTLIVEYGEAVKSYLEVANRPKNEIYNIFSIFIEQTQNINHYNASKTDSPHYEKIVQSSFITIGKAKEGNFVCSGNLIQNEDASALQSLLDDLVLLNKEELKALYKAKLKAPTSPDAKSAGLGMIDMARKASLPFEYSLTRLDEHYTYFTMKTVI
ncbi:hypothetical protein D3C85_739040 [compost metagenome]